MSRHSVRGWSRFGRLKVEQSVCQYRAVRRAVHLALTAVVVAMLPQMAMAVVVTDNFSDLNDTANPTWTHLTGEVGSTDQTFDASTGQYHITAPSNGTVPGLEGYGFGGSYTGPSFNDVRITVDITDFPNSGPIGSWFGVAAHLNGDNSVPTPGSGVGLPLRGYTYQYESSAASGDGEMVINLLYGDGLKDIRSQKGQFAVPLLDNTKDYRIVFEVIGNALHGQVFEINGSGSIVAKVAEQWRDVEVEPIGNIDDDGNNATPEVPFNPADFASGFSGVYGVGYVLLSDADFTIDNFKTETAVAGDYNHNGTTDAADYILWRNTVGNTGPTANPPASFSDMSANGAVSAGEFGQIIDSADYTFWRSKFGSSASGSGLGGGSAVPEPSTVLIVLLGLTGFACRRSGR